MVKTHRKLFGATAVSIGWISLTGWEISDMVLGGNRLTQISEWDEVLLAEKFKILSDLDLDFDLEITGFDYGEIENPLSADEDPEDEAPVPVVGAPPAVAVAGGMFFFAGKPSFTRVAAEHLKELRSEYEKRMEKIEEMIGSMPLPNDGMSG